MDSSDLEDILGAVRRFVRDVVVPAEDEIEETDAIPDRLREQAAEMGLFGFAIPEEYGGLGLSMSEEVRLVFELGYASPAFRSMFGTNNGIAGHVLIEGGTEEQRKQFLPRLASGEWTASFGLTEAEAGSDPWQSRHGRRSGRGRVDHQRQQALHHQRPARRRLHDLRPHHTRRLAGQGHLRVPTCRGTRPG